MERRPDIAPRTAARIVAVLTLAALVLRLIQLTRFSFWADECLTMFVTQMPLRKLLEVIVMTDVHPPFFYVLLHAWQAVSHNEVYLRSISVLPGVLAVPVIYLLARELVTVRAAVIAATLIAFNPLHIVQSQQVRYPAFFMLLTMLVVLAFYRTLYRPKAISAIALGVAALAMTYTNYIGLGVMTFVGLWIAIEWKRRPPGRVVALAVWGAVCLRFALWLPILLIQSQRLPHSELFPPGKIALYTLLDFTYGIGFWGMPRTGSRDAELAVLGLDHSPWILAASLVPFALLVLAGLYRKKDGRRLTFDKMWLAVVLFFAWTICATSNIFQAKYILPALPAFAIVVAAGIDRFLARWKTLAAALLLLVYVPTTAYGLGTFWTKEMAYEEHYRELAKFLDKRKEPGDAVLMFHAIAEACVTYYVAGDLPDVFIAPRNEDNDQMDAEKLLDQLLTIEANYDRMWVVYYYEGHRDPRHFARTWFETGGQFRKVDGHVPKRLADVVELYEVVFKPPPESDGKPE